MSDVEIIKNRLGRLRETYPDLDSVIKLIPEDLSITEELMKTYYESSVAYGIKSQVLRILFKEKKLFTESEANNDFFNIDSLLVKRISDFFLISSKIKDKPIMNFTKDDISKSISNILGIPSSTPRLFFNEFGTVPYYKWGKNIKPYDKYEISNNDDLSFLKPFFDIRFIAEDVVEEFITKGVSQLKSSFLFDTGIKELDIRNMLYYAHKLLFTNEESYILQSKIPRLVSDRLEFNRLSLPELALVADISYLIYNNIISKNCFDSNNTRDQLLSKLSEMKDFEDFDEIMKKDKANWFLTEEKIDLLVPRSYKNYLLFNTSGLFDEYTQFSKYYDAQNINIKNLEDKLFEHLKIHTDTSIQNKIFNTIRSCEKNSSELVEGIKRVNLANILFYTSIMEKRDPKKGRSLMPLAAIEFFEGKRVVIKSQKKNGNLDNKNQSRSSPEIAAKELPRELVNLLDTYSNVYFIPKVPFCGILPDDGLIYIPKALASIYTNLPENVIVIEDDFKLNFGEDYSKYIDKYFSGLDIKLI